MAGRGPAPKANSRTRHKPLRGSWKPTTGSGWQHADYPEPPEGLLPATVAVWHTWLRSWWAANWRPEDLPGLYQVIRLYDMCESYFADPYTTKTNPKGEPVYVLKPNPATELRQMMDNYGITPKGQQDRRWQPPKDDAPAKPEPESPDAGKYGYLRAVG